MFKTGGFTVDQNEFNTLLEVFRTLKRWKAEKEMSDLAAGPVSKVAAATIH